MRVVSLQSVLQPPMLALLQLRRLQATHFTRDRGPCTTALHGHPLDVEKFIQREQHHQRGIEEGEGKHASSFTCYNLGAMSIGHGSGSQYWNITQYKLSVGLTHPGVLI